MIYEYICIYTCDNRPVDKLFYDNKFTLVSVVLF